MHQSWEENIGWRLGRNTLSIIRKHRKYESDFHLVCKKCGCSLRPWNRDDIYVINYHLEEHYSIPMESGPKKNPSKRFKERIFALYNRKCFNCGTTKDLHIDHILPRSHGGDAAFRNLQPLCSRCGGEKGDSLPEQAEVYSDFYFTSYPLDGHEGLFW